ncbi:hypothetical protein EDB86DRAFT_2912777 [Lactarius hatsudake]|nr:hypothetical protein EDB86DRAFT_2912777 [Lactarius hatsudake]
MKKEFDGLYGSDETDINNWLKLCFVLRIDLAHDTLQKCRAAVLKTHVNLVGLVHGSKRKSGSSKRKKNIANTRKKRRNSLRRKTQWMVACCAPCDVTSYFRGVTT